MPRIRGGGSAGADQLGLCKRRHIKPPSTAATTSTTAASKDCSAKTAKSLTS